MRYKKKDFKLFTLSYFIAYIIIYYLRERMDIFMNENNIDMTKLMQMLSKMDKNQLEKGLKQVQQIINSKDNNKNR